MYPRVTLYIHTRTSILLTSLRLLNGKSSYRKFTLRSFRNCTTILNTFAENKIIKIVLKLNYICSRNIGNCETQKFLDQEERQILMRLCKNFQQPVSHLSKLGRVKSGGNQSSTNRARDAEGCAAN